MFNKNSQHGSILFIKSAGNISIPSLGHPPAVFDILTLFDVHDCQLDVP